MGKFINKQLTISFSTMAILIFYLISFNNSNTGAVITQGTPFWMPLEFDLGKGYFKTNVFIVGLQEDTGLTKVCVIPETMRYKLCHYMDAKEEGQLIGPNISVHAGIYVFPSSYIPVNSSLNTCITIMKDQKTECKVINNTAETIEEKVYLTLQK